MQIQIFSPVYSEYSDEQNSLHGAISGIQMNHWIHCAAFVFQSLRGRWTLLTISQWHVITCRFGSGPTPHSVTDPGTRPQVWRARYLKLQVPCFRWTRCKLTPSDSFVLSCLKQNVDRMEKKTLVARLTVPRWNLLAKRCNKSDALTCNCPFKTKNITINRY